MPSHRRTPNASVQPSSRVFGCKPTTHTPISTFTVICVHCNSVCVKSSFGMRNRQHVCKRHVVPLCVGVQPSVLVSVVNVLGTNTHDAGVLVNAAHVNTKYMPEVRATANKVTETGNVHCTFVGRFDGTSGSHSYSCPSLLCTICSSLEGSTQPTALCICHSKTQLLCQRVS